MKKFLIITLIFLSIPVYASNWVEVFEKQSIDFDSIETYGRKNKIKFWVKSEPKTEKDNFLGKNVAYTLSYWDISCKQKKSRIDSVIIYDKNLKILHSDDTTPKYENIAPDTYNDGYYRLFCLIPFKDNPLLQKH